LPPGEDGERPGAADAMTGELLLLPLSLLLLLLPLPLS
jgi:hypothetical protein